MAKQTFTTGQVLTAAQMTSLQQTAMGGGSTTAKTASYVLVAADAGTVVQMNSASATTITVNTALFAAGDTVEIQNVGAGVCTVTAGTATVSTSSVLTLQQYDAGSLYFNSTSAAIFFASDAANSPLTTKGDLFTYSTSDTRLAVGNNGEQILADSAAATGLRYQSAYNGNSVINGAFDIWQRGTSIAVGAAYPYTADRWQAVRGGVVAGMTVSRQTSGLTGTQYCARIQRDSGNTSTASMGLYNAFESSNTYPLAGQAVTFSFYARAGANYSGGTLSGILTTGTGTDQNPITAVYTGATSPISVSATLTTSWQRFQGTATLSSSATEMYVYFQWIPTGTAGANDYVEVSGVQVELGSIATTFKRAGGATIQGELAACQRYYARESFAVGGSGVYLPGIGGMAISTTIGDINVTHSTTMRIAPTSIETGVSAVYDWRTGAQHSSGTFTLYTAAPERSTIRYTHGSAVFAINDYLSWVSTGAGSLYLAFNAEL